MSDHPQEMQQELTKESVAVAEPVSERADVVPADALPEVEVESSRPLARLRSALTPPLVISTLALLVSGLGFYFQNVRVLENVSLALAHPEFSEKGRVAFDAVFANGGNRTIAVTGMSVAVKARQPGESYEFKVAMPTLVLKPGDAVSQPVCIAIPHFAELKSGERPALVLVQPEIVTSAGGRYRPSLEAVAVGRVKDSETRSFPAGEVVDTTPSYHAVIKTGPASLLGAELTKVDEPLSIGFSGSKSLQTEFERRKGLFLDRLLSEVGCTSPVRPNPSTGTPLSVNGLN